MAYLIPNSFSRYYLTDEEELNGSTFTIDQIQVLQNDLASIAEEKINLEFDPKNPEEFIQAEAFKSGQIALLQYMLERSEAMKEARVTKTSE